MRRMSTAQPKDPLAATDRLLIDGSNPLHALSRGSDRGAGPPAALIGRLRGVVPPTISIDLVFDGPSERGLRGERIAAGLIVRYSGARTGDAVILSLVDEIGFAEGPEATAGVLVVTDDRDLRHRLKGLGARTAGCAWLIGRLERTTRKASASIGNAKPPHQAKAASRAPDAEDEERVGWRTGRGATTKRRAIRSGPRRAPPGPRRVRLAERAALGGVLLDFARDHRRAAQRILELGPPDGDLVRHPRLGCADRAAAVFIFVGVIGPFLTFTVLGALYYQVRKPRVKLTFEEDRARPNSTPTVPDLPARPAVLPPRLDGLPVRHTPLRDLR